MQLVVDPKSNPAVAGSAPAILNGLILVWADSNQVLWWTSCEPIPGPSGVFAWRAFAQLGGRSSASPSLALTFAGNPNLIPMFCWAAWKGSGKDNGIYLAELPDDPVAWEVFSAFPGIGTSATPALNLSGLGLVMAFKGESDTTLYYMLYSPAGTGAFVEAYWGPPTPIPGAFSSHAPALAAQTFNNGQLGNTVYMVYKDPVQTTLWMTQLTFTPTSGLYWVEPGPVLLPDNIRSDREPGLYITPAGILWIAFKGESDNSVWVASYNETSWTQPVKIPGIGTSGRPALVPMPNNGIGLAIIGETTGHLYFGLPAELQGS